MNIKISENSIFKKNGKIYIFSLQKNIGLKVERCEFHTKMAVKWRTLIELMFIC